MHGNVVGVSKTLLCIVKIYIGLKKCQLVIINRKVKVDWMVKLADLGFCSDVIFETIVSTFNQDRSPNAAPMGIIMLNEQQVALNIFNSSITLRNLKATKSAVINLTSDIDVFYKTALKEANPNGELPREWFDKAQTVNAPKLVSAEATIEITLDNTTLIDPQKTQAVCSIKQINASKTYPQTYCRAMPAVMEAIIHATRIKALINNPQEQECTAKLTGLIENCQDIVNRSAPNSHYSEIMTDLQKRIASWRV